MAPEVFRTHHLTVGGRRHYSTRKIVANAAKGMRVTGHEPGTTMARATGVRRSDAQRAVMKSDGGRGASCAILGRCWLVRICRNPVLVRGLPCRSRRQHTCTEGVSSGISVDAGLSSTVSLGRTDSSEADSCASSCVLLLRVRTKVKLSGPLSSD